MVCLRLLTERLLDFLPPDILPHTTLLGFLPLLRHEGNVVFLRVIDCVAAFRSSNGYLATVMKHENICNTTWYGYFNEVGAIAQKQSTDTANTFRNCYPLKIVATIEDHIVYSGNAAAYGSTPDRSTYAKNCCFFSVVENIAIQNKITVIRR